MQQLVGMPLLLGIFRSSRPGASRLKVPGFATIVLALALVSSGCTEDTPATARVDTSVAALRTGAPALLDADLPDLGATEAWRSGPEIEFSYISDVDVDSKGFVYVADPVALKVTVISPDGTPARSIGRKGAGPAEFEGIGSIQAGRGDTLFVFDNNLRRFSAFAPGEDTVAYTTRIAEFAGGAPQRAYRSSTGSRMVVMSMPAFQAGASDAQGAGRRLVARVLRADGSVERDSLLTGVATSNLFIRNGAMISVGTNAFGRQPIFRFTRSDRLVYARSDSTVIQVTNLDGGSARRCAFSTVPVPVTSSDVDREQELTIKRLRQVLVDSVPAAWPAMVDLVVDEADGVWFGLRGSGGAADKWVLCDKEGRFTGTVKLPPTVTPVAVRGGLMYAVARDEDEVPSIRAYRLANSPTIRN